MNKLSKAIISNKIQTKSKIAKNAFKGIITADKKAEPIINAFKGSTILKIDKAKSVPGIKMENNTVKVVPKTS